MSENQQTMEAVPVARKNAESKVGKPEMFRLGIALFGGILVLNCYLSRVFFSNAIDETARDFSALIGALILSLPIFFEAIRDLIQGKVHMNELVALALVAAFASKRRRRVFHADHHYDRKADGHRGRSGH